MTTPRRSRVRRWAASAAPALALLPGCYAVEDGPERMVIRHSETVQLVLLAIPAGVAFVGLVLCLVRPLRLPGVAVVVGTLGFGGLIIPGICLDTVTITPTGATQRTGFWFAPTVNRIDFAAVDEVEIRAVRNNRTVDRTWFVRRTDGRTDAINFGDLWEQNEEVIVRKLRGYGVRVAGDPADDLR